MIRKGDRVTLKPEWQDAGDDHYDWFAAEDSHDARGAMPRLKVTAIHKDPAHPSRAWYIQPVHTVRQKHINERF